MNITLYQFAKRANSTKRPNGTSKGVQGTLKQNTSMLAPTVGFNFGTSESPKSYNYAYISDFGRFYFIDDWFWDTGLWYASMTVDPLATWRAEIGSSSEYVLRAASACTPDIIDTTYPTFAGATLAKLVVTSPFTDNIAGGTFIMSVQAGGSYVKFGTNTTIAATPAAMNRLANMLLSDADYLSINTEEISDGLQKALFNPIQYISYVIWIPIGISFDGYAQLEKVPVGWWELDCGSGFYLIEQANDSVQWNFSIDLPKHPQNDAKHTFLQGAPYSEYKLYYPGFGLLDIDASKLYNQEKLYCTLKIDLYTGNMTLQLCLNGYGGVSIQTLTGACGVQAQIGQISSMVSSASGIVQTVTGGIVGGVKSFFSRAQDITAKVHDWINGANTLGISSDLGAVANDIQSGAQQATAESVTKGGQGSVIEYQTFPYLLCKFWKIVDQMPEHRGYPVCKQMKISSLSGYIMCADSDFSAPATSQEISAVKAHLDAGFYYE